MEGSLSSKEKGAPPCSLQVSELPEMPGNQSLFLKAFQSFLFSLHRGIKKNVQSECGIADKRKEAVSIKVFLPIELGSVLSAFFADPGRSAPHFQEERPRLH